MVKFCHQPITYANRIELLLLALFLSNLPSLPDLDAALGELQTGYHTESSIDFFNNKKIGQVDLHPAREGWILDILNPQPD